jgi:MHS family citrate/tricarballylate:H+ symporter-like MFS transporter
VRNWSDAMTPSNPVAGSSTVSLARMVAIGLGNALEFYDFMIFSFFAVQIGHAFFPAELGARGLLYTLATFGVGFFTRPLGGIVIGRYGDRRGRKPAMMWSFGLMGVAILGMALTPSYASIGHRGAHPAVVFPAAAGVCGRRRSGPDHRLCRGSRAARSPRALCVHAADGTGPRGVVLRPDRISRSRGLLPPADLDAYGWRVALLLGVLIVPIGLLIRSRLPETLEKAVAQATHESGGQSPWRVFFVGLMVVGAGTIAGYGLTYLSTYSQDTLKLGAQLAFVTTIAQGLGYLSCAYAGGWLGDRLGHRRMLLLAFGLLLVLMLPAFVLINRWPTAATLFWVTALLSMIHITAIVCMSAFLVESLAPTVRSGTFAMTYATGVALLGGTTQLVLKLLIDSTGSAYAPPWYIICALAAGMLALTQLRQAAVDQPHVMRSAL